MGCAARAEAALIEAARLGDDAAFEELFARYERTLREYARRWLPPAVRRRVSESDVLQEAHLVALRRIADFEQRDENGFRNWLLKILEFKVRETVYHHAETKKRDVGLEVTHGARPDTAQMRSHAASPSEMAVASELADLAAEALMRIPAAYREVLSLKQEQQLTLREIAERIGKSREAVKKTYGRALRRFKDEFDQLRGETS